MRGPPPALGARGTRHTLDLRSPGTCTLSRALRALGFFQLPHLCLLSSPPLRPLPSGPGELESG